MNILWLQPHTGDNVSVRRERISEHLAGYGVDVSLIDVTGFRVFSAMFEAIVGDYDIIAGNVRMGLYMGHILSIVLRKPLVGDVSDPLSQINHLPPLVYNLLERYEWFVLKNADASVFVYESSHEEALERGITDPVRLPNAVDYHRFGDPADDVVRKTGEILRYHGVSPDDRIAIYTGSMVDRYHLEEIGKAAEQLPDWEFVFIGRERGADIREIVAGKSNCHFLGSFDYRLIPGFLSHSDLGLCLIDAEQSLKLKEFTAAGLFTLVVPGMKCWHDYDNLVCTKPSPDAITSAVSKLGDEVTMITKTRSQRAELKSWSDIAQGYYKIFRKLRANGDEN